MTSTQNAYQPFEAGAKVKVTGAMRECGGRYYATGNATVISFRYYNGDGGTPEGNRTGGWYKVEMTAGQYKGETVGASSQYTSERAAKTPARNHRTEVAKPDRETLPTIVEFLKRTDSGEYGNATCPHCGALGRYTVTFRCDDGTTRGAMAGCVKLYPVSAEITADNARKAAWYAKGRR